MSKVPRPVIVNPLACKLLIFAPLHLAFETNPFPRRQSAGAIKQLAPLLIASFKAAASFTYNNNNNDDDDDDDDDC